ncbi:tetratricopeptide repeat protein [Paracrocinitomix mangrovi]|uniref:tetratricopeptide repeat-containing sensor histidine kinase n=1 Tax=Paracrocinitomix mangrovi TaxID=2862509 RepID=UPI001C8D6699|nr:tetratricopeptide repeat protein [Paracrocinitomix mangrovi]UKN00807.1 tetratricopeptide repeat protein [Paracrocinitomix mangrovi]
MFKNLGVLFCIVFICANASLGQSTVIQKIDSVFAIARDKSLQDTARANAYLSLTALFFNHNIDSVEYVCSEGIAFVRNAQPKADTASFRSLLKSESTLLINGGVSYYHLNKLDKAVEVWYMALDLKDKLNDKKGMANVLNNIANVEIDLNELDRAKSNFQDILQIQIEIGDSNGIGRTYNSIGYIHRVKGDDSLALDYYSKALEIRSQIGNELGVAACYNNIAFIHRQREEFNQAIKEYEKARLIYEKYDDQIGLLTVLNNLANCYFELGNFIKAKNFATQGYKIASEKKKDSELIHLAEILYKINKQQNNPGPALKYYEEYISLRDTIDSEKHYKALINQELNYEFEQKEKINELNREKERELEELKHENELAIADERSSRLMISAIIVGIGLIVVFILLFFIYRQLKLTKSQKEIIEKQNIEIEMKALRAQMNPHFIFNSLNSINSYIIKNKAEIAADYLTKFAKLMRLVLENSEKNLITLENELESLKYYLDLEQLRFNGNFEYELNIKMDTDFIRVPPLILQPFVENAIWHGLLHKKDGNGVITITVSEIDEYAHIVIEDNGVGRKKASELRTVDPNKKQSMGLNITENRLKALQQATGFKIDVIIEDVITNQNTVAGTRVKLIFPVDE